MLGPWNCEVLRPEVDVVPGEFELFFGPKPSMERELDEIGLLRGKIRP